MPLPEIDFKSVTLDDIIVALTNCGYVVTKDDFDFAYKNDAFQHVGHSGKYQNYWCGLEDDNTGNYFVTTILLHLGSDGRFIADYAGHPVLDNCSEQDVIDFFDKIS